MKKPCSLDILGSNPYFKKGKDGLIFSPLHEHTHYGGISSVCVGKLPLPL